MIINDKTNNVNNVKTYNAISVKLLITSLKLKLIFI